MRYLAALALLALSPLAALAQPACPAVSTVTPIPWNEARLSWAAPTKNTDGSNISGAIVYTVYKLLPAGGGTWTAQCTTSALATSLPNQATTTGPQSYRATAKVPSVDGGIESAPSNVATKTMTAPPLVPNPPATMTIASDTTAWTITQSHNTLGLVAVGRVAPGTTCDLAQPVLGMYVIPREAVTFAGNVKPQVVVGSCS